MVGVAGFGEDGRPGGGYVRTIGSLCTGYGGLDMAVEQHFNARTVWVSEVDKDASVVLEQRYPDVPNLGDLTVLDWESEDVMAAPRNDALAQRMYDRYCQGLSLEQVGEEFRRSRQTVWKMFDRRGWDMRPVRGDSRDGTTYGGARYTLGDLGYLRCTVGDRQYLHRRVWADANGPIPEGHDVHHIDHNKLNNDPTNLRLLTKADHAALHAEEVVPVDTPAVDILTAGYP